MFDIDWQELLIPSKSVLEIIIRGTMVYLFLFIAMRFLPRRTIGAMGPSDLLVIVLIADAVQHAMANNYESVTEGLILAVTIFGWATLIDWLDHRFPEWHIAEAKPLRIVANGKLLRKNMERQQITEQEVLAQLRQHGLDSPEKVVSAYLEGDGHMSVITRSERNAAPPPGERKQHF